MRGRAQFGGALLDVGQFLWTDAAGIGEHGVHAVALLRQGGGGGGPRQAAAHQHQAGPVCRGHRPAPGRLVLWPQRGGHHLVPALAVPPSEEVRGDAIGGAEVASSDEIAVRPARKGADRVAHAFAVTLPRRAVPAREVAHRHATETHPLSS